MRYIPELISQTVVQVPESKNAYSNVLNLGASGKGNIVYSGTISNIQGNLVTLGSITGGNSSDLVPNTDLEVFSYSFVGSAQASLFGAIPPLVTGVDFSSSPGSNPNLAPLTYYVFGYDQQTGVLPNARLTFNIGTKVLNPAFWNTDQYVQLNLSRTSQFAIPIVYRVWGNQVKFLGVIGNNKVGYPGSGVVNFLDLGLTEVPSWDDEPELPEFMSNVFTVVGTTVNQIRTINRKTRLTVEPAFESNPTVLIQARGNVTGLAAGQSVRFYIDDTKYIQAAINAASTSKVKEVFFPSGTYNIRDMFFGSAEGVSLKGSGDSTVIRRLPSAIANSSESGLIKMSGPGMRVTDMKIDGNSHNTFSAVSPIGSEVSLSLSNCEGLVISGLSVINSGGGGILIDNCNSVTFVNNKVRRTGRRYEQEVKPVQFSNCYGVVAQGNIFEYATSNPTFTSTEFSTINSNVIRACGDKGLEFLVSSQWNAQGNVAYSDNDSLIRSIDTYNNEYSRATIEVRRGSAMDPVYMTVTYGGEPVKIVKGTVSAEIFSLSPSGLKGPKVGSFRVLETSSQLDAGIFSLTLPGLNSATLGGETIPSTSSLNDPNGYVYEVHADVLISRGFTPLSIRSDPPYVAIQMRNPSDILALQVYDASSPENDLIRISGFSNLNLGGWDQESGYEVVGIDTDTNSILLNPIPGLFLTTTPTEFLGGTLFILRSGYFVADGNLYVQTI